MKIKKSKIEIVGLAQVLAQARASGPFVSTAVASVRCLRVGMVSATPSAGDERRPPLMQVIVTNYAGLNEPRRRQGADPLPLASDDDGFIELIGCAAVITLMELDARESYRPDDWLCCGHHSHGVGCTGELPPG